MKKKVIVCLTIFGFLLVGAWLLNEQTNRNYIKMVIKDREAIGDQLFTPTEVEAETWNFQPREYIKIRKPMNDF
ncbi:hypothetical protein ACWM35_13310 [Neobacillus sp. K501]